MKTWNSLPEEVVKQKSVNQFKNKLGKFFKKLEEEKVLETNVY